jgi:hypothetical protein
MDSHQLEKMHIQAGNCIAAFRWLWILNALAAIAACAMRHYEVAIVSGVSACVALVGTGIARTGRKTLAQAVIRRGR